MRVKKESKRDGLKLNIKKTKIMVMGSITVCQQWGKMETVTDFILFSFTITVDADCSHEIKTPWK